MPIITDPHAVRALYAEAAEKGFLIPGLGAENRDTLECCFRAAKRLGEEIGVPNIALCTSVTGRYGGRSQLVNYTSLGCAVEGLLAFADDMRALLRPGGPFDKLRVHAHLDHGQPGLDDDLFEAGRGVFGSVMYDASALSLDENREKTAKFVSEWKDVYLIEGAVDEITEYGGAHAPDDDLTKPEDARLFLDETGVDLIVVNVGTEHRATADRVKYHGDRARSIAEVAGGKMVLHGSSSLGDQPLGSIAQDGFVRFNMWTGLETKAGQALARDTIRNLHHLLPTSEVRELVDEGWLGGNYRDTEAHPSLEYLPHQYRRDKVWAPALEDVLHGVLSQCGYERIRS